MMGEASTGLDHTRYSTRLCLPKYRDLPLTKKIYISETATGIPAALNPLTAEAEKDYLEKIIRILNTSACATLSENI